MHKVQNRAVRLITDATSLIPISKIEIQTSVKFLNYRREKHTSKSLWEDKEIAFITLANSDLFSEKTKAHRTFLSKAGNLIAKYRLDLYPTTFLIMLLIALQFLD